jgi:hypothetical protein
MTHKMFIFKAGINFHTLPTADIYCLHVGNDLLIEVYFSNTQQMTTTIMKSSIGGSKNQFHSGIDFSQGIDSVESMPGD